jgi:putative ABC transport system substrate-binding protein
MDRRHFLLTSLAVTFAGAVAAAGTIPRIGLLRTNARDAPDPAVDGLRQGLRQLGYVEGQSIQLEPRWAEGRPERLPALAAQLVALNVDVIVTGGEQARSEPFWIHGPWPRGRA